VAINRISMCIVLILAALPSCSAYEDIKNEYLDAGVQLSVGSDCIDRDGDGYGLHCDHGSDCRDNDAHVHPGAIELCNGIDDNRGRGRSAPESGARPGNPLPVAVDGALSYNRPLFGCRQGGEGGDALASLEVGHVWLLQVC
jgi:hypothetical protein